jgi:hypothetical protein
VIAHPETGDPIAHGANVEDGWSLDLSVDAEAIDLDLLVYGCRLETLGLSGGSIPIDSTGRPPPAPVQVFTSRVEGDTPSEWSALDAVPDRSKSLALDFPVQPECAELTPTEVRLTGRRESPRLLHPIDRNTVLVGLADGELMRVSIDGTVETVSTRRDSGQIYVASWQGERIYYGAEGGCFAAGDPILPGAPFACSARSTSSYMWLDGDDRGNLDLHALTGHGELLAIEGTSVVEIPLSVTSSIGRKGGLLHLGPDDVLVAGTLPSEVVRVRAGAEAREMLAVGTFDDINSVHRTQLGVVVTTNFGVVYIRRGESWEIFSNAGVQQARHAVDLRDGILVGGVSVVAEVRPDGTACLGEVFFGGDIRRMVRAEDRIVLAGDPEAEDARVVFLDVFDPALTCR